MSVKALQSGRTGREFTGWHMLASMLAFFAVIVGVNLVLAISASRSWSGLVVTNSYVASQEFNTKERLAREQQALGWRASLTYVPGRLQLEIRDREGRPVPLGPVAVDLTRPLGDSEDRTVVLAGTGDGFYIAEVTLPAGAWNAETRAAQTPRGAFERHSRFVAP